MDNKKWVLKNCKFAQVRDPNELHDPNELQRELFLTLSKDPEMRYTKADITKAMRDMGFDPLDPQYAGLPDELMGMLRRWYQLQDEQRKGKGRGRDEGPNEGRIGQPPIPGRGY
jgi:hypothetical protein